MKIKENFALVVIMIMVAALTRLIPHWPNFTAVGAMALFGGAYLGKRISVLIPLLALFISDLVLNNLIYARIYPEYYDSFIFFRLDSLWIYGAFVVIVLIGMFVVKKRSLGSIIGTSLLASVSFFAITNFAVWISSMMYPRTLEGLMACYGAGVPFFWNTVAGDLFFVAVLFGGYEAITTAQHRRAVKQTVD